MRQGRKLLMEGVIMSGPVFTDRCQVIEDQRVASTKHSYPWSGACLGWVIHVQPLTWS